MILYLIFVLGLCLADDESSGSGDGMAEAQKQYEALHGPIKEEDATLNAEIEEEPEAPCEATKQDEAIYQAKQLSKIVLEDQITKTKDLLRDVTAKVESLKYSLPTNEKSDECLQITTCKECTKNVKCGWCAMEERCVAGDNVGPLYTMCNFYNSLYCSGECARYVDCYSCVEDTGCGWCEDQAHMVIGCIKEENEGLQCPPQYLIAKDQCPMRKIEIVRTVSDKKKKETKAEEPNEASSKRAWEDSYVIVRQGRYKERMASLKSNAQGVGQGAGQSELDSLYDQKAELTSRLKRYTKQYKQLVAENQFLVETKQLKKVTRDLNEQLYEKIDRLEELYHQMQIQNDSDTDLYQMTQKYITKDVIENDFNSIKIGFRIALKHLYQVSQDKINNINTQNIEYYARLQFLLIVSMLINNIFTNQRETCFDVIKDQIKIKKLISPTQIEKFLKCATVVNLINQTKQLYDIYFAKK